VVHVGPDYVLAPPAPVAVAGSACPPGRGRHLRDGGDCWRSVCVGAARHVPLARPGGHRGRPGG